MNYLLFSYLLRSYLFLTCTRHPTNSFLLVISFYNLFPIGFFLLLPVSYLLLLVTSLPISWPFPPCSANFSLVYYSFLLFAFLHILRIANHFLLPVSHSPIPTQKPLNPFLLISTHCIQLLLFTCSFCSSLFVTTRFLSHSFFYFLHISTCN